MSTEYLDQTNLQGRDLAVPVNLSGYAICVSLLDLHENTSEIQLDLETDVDIGTIDRRTPPQCEPTIGDLIQTGPLSVRELLVSHGLFETRRLLPEQTYVAEGE